MNILTIDEAKVFAKRIMETAPVSKEQFFSRIPRVVYGPRGTIVFGFICCSVIASYITYLLNFDSSAMLISGLFIALSIYGIISEFSSRKMALTEKGVGIGREFFFEWSQLEKLCLVFKKDGNGVLCRVVMTIDGSEVDFPNEHADAIGVFFALTTLDKREIQDPENIVGISNPQVTQGDEDEN